MKAPALRSSVTRRSERRLRSAWRRERWLCHSRGFLYLAIWLASLIVFDLVVDWLFGLPGIARPALLAGNIAVILHVGWRAWWRHLKPYSSTQVALEVERRHPDLKSLLVSHVQIGAGQGDVDQASPALIRAMHAEAVERTRPLDFSAGVRFRDLKWLAVAALCVLAVFGTSFLYAADFYRVLFARLLDPSSNAAYPTRTRIEWVTGDVIQRQGDPLEIRASTSGETPPGGILWLAYESDRWEEVEVKRTGEAEFAWSTAEASRGFAYMWELGDALSSEHTVTVVPAPRVRKSLVRLRYPEYTKLGVEESTMLSFEALEGTDISWEIQCDRALASASVTVETTVEPQDARTTPLQIAPDDPTAVTFRHHATLPFSYRFTWKELEHGFLYEDPVRYAVRVVPDAPPRVEILEPTEDEKATVRKEVTITFRPTDDFGLRDASIVYAVNEGPEARKDLGSVADYTGQTVTVRWQPRDSVSELKEGDVVAYAIEVRDNAAPSPDQAESGAAAGNIGRSRTLRIEVVSVEDYLRLIAERKSELFSELRGVLQDETEGARSVKNLVEETQ